MAVNTPHRPLNVFHGIENNMQDGAPTPSPLLTWTYWQICKHDIVMKVKLAIKGLTFSNEHQAGCPLGLPIHQVKGESSLIGNLQWVHEHFNNASGLVKVHWIFLEAKQHRSPPNSSGSVVRLEYWNVMCNRCGHTRDYTRQIILWKLRGDIVWVSCCPITFPWVTMALLNTYSTSQADVNFSSWVQNRTHPFSSNSMAISLLKGITGEQGIPYYESFCSTNYDNDIFCTVTVAW